MAFDVGSLPRFSGPRLEIVKSVAEAVHRLVVRAMPDEQWIRNKFLQRTIGEVLEDGFTVAYLPCIERGLVAAAILAAHEIESYFILQDMPNSLWHFILEVKCEDSSWVWLDYSKDETRLFSGRFMYARLPDSEPRFLRIKAPKFGPLIWNSRPPLRLLAAVGVSLSARYDRFCKLRVSVEEQFHSGSFTLEDRLIYDPRDSVWADLWARFPVVGADFDERNYTDLSDVHLRLETCPDNVRRR